MFKSTIYACAAIILAVGLVHAFIGIAAIRYFGADLPEMVLRNPALDSQDRFYGCTFLGYALLLVLYIGDTQRYAPVLRIALGVVFLGGVSRLLSAWTYGWPPPLIVALLLVELGVPPLLFALAPRPTHAR